MATSISLNDSQMAVAHFMDASRDLRFIAEDTHFPELGAFADRFLAGVTGFGRTEMEFGRRNRVANLASAGFAPDALEGLHDVKWRLASNFNLQGVQLLDGASRLVEGAQRIRLPEHRPDLGDDVAALRRDLSFHLAELEIKPSDAVRIAEAAKPILDLASRGDVTALYKEVADRAVHLQKLRSTEDRGTQDNIPVWKVAAIVVAVGIWVWALFKCKWWGSCSLKEGLGYFIAFWIAALIAKFC
jgi:hypothetical protein